MNTGLLRPLLRGHTASRCVSRIKHSFSTTPAMEGKPVEKNIREKLAKAFQPVVLEVINESGMHNVPKGSETHFKVVVVSSQFDSQPLIKRHRMVNEVLQNELQNGVHALSIMAKTPSQWEDSEKIIGKSPPCQGGAGL
ncbi:bolA-like protein DDB_G0274169 [Liolophura sinensis]|uniref:bolA-like protein DDB_G0274169 n=1 Tax=Liolophura sinensis TaxID=3198878 RepID=UPI0031584A71